MDTREQKRARALLRPMRQREDLASLDFARSRGDVAMLEEHIVRLERSLAVHNEFARQALAPQVIAGRATRGRSTIAAPADLSFYRKCVADITGELADCRQRLRLAQQTLQRRQEELLDARKQHKVFEQLAEKVDARANAHAQQRATAEMDHAHEAQRSWQRSDPADGQE